MSHLETEPDEVKRLADVVAAELRTRMSAFNPTSFNPTALDTAARIAVETMLARLGAPETIDPLAP